MRASHKLYIGCYSEKQWWVEGQPGEGLYVFDFDAETGGLALDQIERTVVSPSWSVVHPSGKYLFVVTEKGPDDSEADSFVTCYRIAASGTLTYLSKQLTGGTGGNCIAVVGDSAVVCTNYFTGSLASFPFNPQTGALGPATVTPHVQKATGPIADRQEAAPISEPKAVDSTTTCGARSTGANARHGTCVHIRGGSVDTAAQTKRQPADVGAKGEVASHQQNQGADQLLDPSLPQPDRHNGGGTTH